MKRPPSPTPPRGIRPQHPRRQHHRQPPTRAPSHTLSGSASDPNTAYASGGISITGNETVTLSDTTLAASILNTLDGNTTGTVNANTSPLSAQQLTSTLLTPQPASAISAMRPSPSPTPLSLLPSSTPSTAYHRHRQRQYRHHPHRRSSRPQHCLRLIAGITGLGNEAATLSDTTSPLPSSTHLDGNTTGAVDAGIVTTLWRRRRPQHCLRLRRHPAISAMKRPPSPTPPSPLPSSTASTATPQAPSTRAPSHRSGIPTV